ncbi:endothelial cell-specific chemotaxis regulator isoform X2 [Narcine bancroftii]|uniref:endothelial cell-specific chemotaxis regulator isoform X2 n=1 Tax=Narcine bancroftii TaxID=1343680 RepID=UPI003831BCEB
MTKGTITTESTTSIIQTNPKILPGTTSNGTTNVTASYTTSSVTSSKTFPQQITTEVSSSSSIATTFSITPTARRENSTSEITVSGRIKTTVNASSGENSTSFTGILNGQRTYFTTISSMKETEDPATEVQPTPTPSSGGTSSLTVLAFAVIILILILVIVVVILVCVIGLRFKCCDCREAPQDTITTRNEAPSESSQVNGEKESITLVSMRTLYTEAGGQESSMQGYLRNDSTGVDEMINNFKK